MKLNLTRNRRIREALQQIRIDYPEGVPSILSLKKQVVLSDILRFHLEQDGDESGQRVLFHCFKPENHSNGDETPSLWCYDDYHDSGMGRWGCPVCLPSGGDVYDFLISLHGYSTSEAYRAVKVWRDRHRPSRTVRVRLRGGGR